jgi:hypothetical protein
VQKIVILQEKHCVFSLCSKQNLGLSYNEIFLHVLEKKRHFVAESRGGHRHF